MIKLENITSLFIPLCEITFRILKYIYKYIHKKESFSINYLPDYSIKLAKYSYIL